MYESENSYFITLLDNLLYLAYMIDGRPNFFIITLRGSTKGSLPYGFTGISLDCFLLVLITLLVFFRPLVYFQHADIFGAVGSIFFSTGNLLSPSLFPCWCTISRHSTIIRERIRSKQFLLKFFDPSRLSCFLYYRCVPKCSITIDQRQPRFI